MKKVISKSIPALLLLISSVFSASSAFAYDWIPAGNGGRGSDPIRANYVQNDTYYVCAGKTQNGFQAGHLGENQSKCYVSWGSSSVGFTSYYVIQGSQDVQWVDRNVADSRKAISLDPENGYRTLICRAPNGLPGKVIQGGLRSGVCITAWGNSNFTNSNFEVLVRK